jgi:two-component system, cell cycle response regulator DivK
MPSDPTEPIRERRKLPRPQRILVVDDSEDMRELWSMWLQFWGFVVECASNGLEAVRKARTFQPHIVLMDIWMPVVDGLVATETLKADPHMKDVPVLAMSSDGYSPAAERAREAGCDAFLEKPVNPEVLLTAIRHSLRTLVTKPGTGLLPSA